MTSPTSPMLFSGPMVRAILDGRKTQTRRVLKGRKDVNFGCELAPCELAGEINQGNFDNSPYAPGDLLWVRESGILTPGRAGGSDLFRHDVPQTEATGFFWVRDTLAWGAGYSAAGCSRAAALATGGSKVVPSIHMPRWASRLTLEVTDVRVERLQDISEDDAEAEGVTKVKDHCYVVRGFGYDESGLCHSRATIPFAQLWDSLNEARGVGWDVNPWVVAVTFKPHAANVDALLSQREAA